MTTIHFKLFPVQVVYCDILLHVFTLQVFIKSIRCFRCSLRSWGHKDLKKNKIPTIMKLKSKQISSF